MARNEKDKNQIPENDEGVQITPPDKDANGNVEMCILCEKKPAYKTATVDSDLCEECRQGFMRTPFHFGGIVAVVFAFAMIISSVLLLLPQFSAAKTICDSYKSVKAGDYDTAFSSITEIVTTGKLGWKTAGAFAELCNKRNQPDDMTYLIENYFYDKEAEPTLQWQDIAGKANLNSSWNSELKENYHYLIRIEEIANEKSATFTDYYSQLQNGTIEVKDIPYDEIIRKYSAEFAAATTNEEKGVICYYMLATSSICDKDIKTQYEYCRSIRQYIPKCYWLYIDNLITLSIQAGEYEEAKANIDILSGLNTTDQNYAKRYTAMMYRYQGKYTESLTILEDLIANMETTGIYEAYYEAMLCELLTGDLQSAYEYSTQCVENEFYLTYESINLYALLSKHFGDSDGYKYASEIFAQYGMKISPTVDKFLNGEITMEEIFKDSEVVFE